ncbi:MAG: substrate-binding domain-containing protein [Rectinemataceae bacterium]|jgi:ABC-type sugar transport system substrate-binding protein
MKKTVSMVLIGLALLLQGVVAQQQPASSDASGGIAFLNDSEGLKNGSYVAGVPKPSKNYMIADLTRTLMNAHWVKNKAGFEAAAKHYGVTGNVFAVQTEQDMIDQANILDTLIEQKYDAIIVSPISEQNLLPGLAKASAAGIVIINVDTATISPASAKENKIVITSRIGSNNYDAGVMAAQFISTNLGSKKGEVAVIEGNPGDTVAIDRTAGFREKAKSLANLKMVASQTGKWDRLKSLEVTTGILRANPKIVGIYCNNDTMVLGAMQAASDLGYTILNSDTLNRAGEEKTLMLIGNDGIAEALAAVQDGSLTGTIAQKPFLMGYSALEVAIKKLQGKPVDAKIVTPIKLVVKSDYPNN